MDKLKGLIMRVRTLVSEHKVLTAIIAVILVLNFGVGGILALAGNLNAPIKSPGYSQLEFHNSGTVAAVASRAVCAWQNPTIAVTKRGWFGQPKQAVACFGGDGRYQFVSSNPGDPGSTWVQVR